MDEEVKDRFQAWWRSLPHSIRPIYQTPEPNSVIPLYSGAIGLSCGEKRTEGEGSVDLKWLPAPELEFVASCDAPDVVFSYLVGSNDTHATLELLDRKITVPVIITRFTGAVTGSLRQGTVLGGGDHVAYVIFHVVNFHEFKGTRVISDTDLSGNRLVMETAGWRVAIDSVEQSNHLQECFESEGGYAITHVGKLEREDGNSFTVQQGDDVLQALHFLLSFTRGLRTPVILPVGFDPGGHRCWEKWDMPASDSWRTVQSWFDLRHPESLSEVFPGFLRRWADATWRDPVTLAIHWYLESNVQAGGAEAGAMVLEQAALELLSWVLLVVDEATITKRRFKQENRASDNIRLLLARAGVAPDIPADLKRLKQFVADQHWDDGPDALTEIRNGMVHPYKREDIFAVPFGVRVEAWQLGLWYLDVCLLHLFGFRGQYVNRLQANHRVGDVEPMPGRAAD